MRTMPGDGTRGARQRGLGGAAPSARVRAALCAGLALVLLVPAAPAEAARGRIVCESRNRNFNECRVRTDNNVRLVRQLSRDECRRNRSWGFDSNRIWVDRGCRAEFEFGRDNRGSSGSNNAAIAAGVIGAIALGAAIAGSNQPPPPPPQFAPPPPPAPPPQFTPPPPPPPQPNTGTLPVPSWAIGSFRAWDGEAAQTVQLVIQANGRATLRDQGGQTINWGDVQDGFIVWSQGSRSWLGREGDDLVIGDVGTARVFNFVRS